MKLLIDNALSPIVAQRLSEAGHDAVHVRDLGMARSTDGQILGAAIEQDRIIDSADTDFGTLLLLGRLSKPSFILLRGDVERHPEAQAELLIRELPVLEADLLAGAIVAISRNRIRARRLSRPSG